MPSHLWKVILLPLALLLYGMPARADYSELDEQRDHAYRDWTVAATSPDRRWLGHAVHAKLVIRDTANLAKRHEVNLPFALTGLAIDNSGDRVVGVATRGCVVVIQLSRTSQPSFSWLPGLGSVNDTQGLQPCSTASVKSSWLAEQFLPPQQPVSLDAAGRRVAALRLLPTGEQAVQVVDVNTGTAQIIFPAGQLSGAMTFIEFRDDGKTLLVSSDTSQALWNIETGELINLVDTPFQPFVGAVDGRSGRVYRSDGQGGIFELDAARCAEPPRRWAGPSQQWETMHMADSRSWYATANGQDISVFATATHARLATFRARNEVAWLFEDRQDRLLAVSRIKKSDAGALLPGFPIVEAFPLPKSPPAAPAATTPAKRCPAFAEHVLPRKDMATATLVESSQTPLPTQEGWYHRPKGSNVNTCVPDLAWGMTRERQLWIERYDSIERIDPRSGLAVQSVKTPRSPAVCSITWFQQSGFLNWQGDTVSFRPFSGGRQLLTHRPGWRVIHAFVDGPDHFVVQWAPSDFLDKASTVTEPMLSDPDVGLAVRYRFNPLTMVGQLPSRVLAQGTSMGYGVELRPWPEFDEEPDQEPPDEMQQSEDRRLSFMYSDQHKPHTGPAGPIRWESTVTPIRAVRAFTTTKKDSGSVGTTRLWIGLQGRKTDMPMPTRIDSFGSRAAIVMTSETATRVELYDALNRQWLATATIEPGWYVQQTEWLDAEARLLVHACKLDENRHPTKQCALRFYAAP